MLRERPDLAGGIRLTEDSGKALRRSFSAELLNRMIVSSDSKKKKAKHDAQLYLLVLAILEYF